MAAGLVDDHADLLRLHAAGDQVLDLARHRLRLGALVAAAPEVHRDLGLDRAPRLLEPVGDSGHHRPGGVGDVLAAAEGTVEHHHVGLGVQVAKPGGGAGTGPAGRRVVVERAEQVGGVGAELGEDRPAGQGRVLELVDHQEAEALRDLAPHVGPLGEQAPERQYDVAGVEAVGGGEDAVVLGIQRRELAFPPRALAGRLVARRLPAFGGPGGQRFGVDRLRLQRVDAAQEPRQESGRVSADLVVAQRQLVDSVEQHRQPLGRPDGLEERVQSRLGGVVAQQALADRLPGADPKLLEGPLQQRLGAVAQPPRRGARGGQHQHMLGPGSLGGQQGKPARQRLGLAGAGGAENQQRPLAVADRLVLRFARLDLPARAHLGPLGRHSVLALLGHRPDKLAAWRERSKRTPATALI